MTGSQSTSYRYTGQRDEAGIGLYYYRARWYDAAISRFIQVDPVVPAIDCLQPWNRYSYTFDNPLRYLDTDERCPRPADNTINAICVDLFIMTDTILLAGDGDNRSFRSDSESSRAYLHIYLDEEGMMTGDPYAKVSPSCFGGGLVCLGPYDQYNEFSASQDPRSGNITVTWSLINGLSGTARSIASGIEPAGARIQASASRALAGSIQPINREITLSRNSTGSFCVTDLNRDPYPSLEVYQYRQSQPTQTLYGSEEKYGPILGPLFGLTPFSPRDRFSRSSPPKQRMEWHRVASLYRLFERSGQFFGKRPSLVYGIAAVALAGGFVAHFGLYFVGNLNVQAEDFALIALLGPLVAGCILFGFASLASGGRPYLAFRIGVIASLVSIVYDLVLDCALSFCLIPMLLIRPLSFFIFIAPLLLLAWTLRLSFRKLNSTGTPTIPNAQP